MKRRVLFPFILNFLLFTVAFAQSPASSAAASAQDKAVAIPFELVNRHIILKAKVNNSPRTLSFVFDTGDKYAIIDLDLAKELGLNLQGEVKMRGAGGAIPTGSLVKGSSFTIDGLEKFSQPVAMALPIRNLASRLGHDFDGIIGADFIKEFVVEIDYPARVMRLHDKDKFVYAGAGEAIPIQLTAGHPIIEAEVTSVGSAPSKGKFVIDLGSSAALALYSPFVSNNHLLGPRLKTIKALGGAGAGGEVTGQIGRVSELKIGKYRIAQPYTLFSQDKEGAMASAELIGNIGEQIMSRFSIFLDYNRNRIFIEPNATFAAPFERAFSGLSIFAEGSDYRTFRIMHVLENSPGSEAGLQTNDIITAVDGQPAAQLTLTKLTEMFEQPSSYKLTVRRGEQTLQVSLMPRKLI